MLSDRWYPPVMLPSLKSHPPGAQGLVMVRDAPAGAVPVGLAEDSWALRLTTQDTFPSGYMSCFHWRGAWSVTHYGDPHLSAKPFNSSQGIGNFLMMLQTCKQSCLWNCRPAAEGEGLTWPPELHLLFSFTRGFWWVGLRSEVRSCCYVPSITLVTGSTLQILFKLVVAARLWVGPSS